MNVSDPDWKGPFCARKPLSMFVETVGKDDWQTLTAVFVMPERDECGPLKGHRLQVEIGFESLRGARPAVLLDQVQVQQVEESSKPVASEPKLLCAYFRDFENLDPCPNSDDAQESETPRLATLSKWAFDEGEGRLLHDAFAGRNGVVGGSQVQWQGGVLTFSGLGADSRVRVDAGQGIDGSTFEVALEVSPAKSWKSGCLIASQPKSTDFGGFRLCYSTATQVLTFELSNGSAHQEYAAALPRPIEPGKWTQIRVRGHNGTLEFLVGKRSVRRFVVPGLRLYKGPYPLVIGAGIDDPDAGFMGGMRNVTLRSEVAKRDFKPTTPLGFTARGRWPIDEGAGIVVHDIASEHHGVFEAPPGRVSPTWRSGGLQFAGAPEAGGVMIRNAGPFYGDDFVIDFEAMFEDPRNDWGSLLVSKTGSAVHGGFVVDYSGGASQLTIKLADGKRSIKLEPKLPFALTAGVWIPMRVRFAHEELAVTVAGVEIGRFDLPGFVLARAVRPLLVGAYYYPPSKGITGSIRNVALYMRDESIAEDEVEFLQPGMTGIASTDEPCRAKPLREIMIVGSNVVVPNWLAATCKRKIRGDARFEYEVDLPVEFALVASGSNFVHKGKVASNKIKKLGKHERDGRIYRSYRVELSYHSTAGGASGFGPLFISAKDQRDGADPEVLPRMYFRESGSEQSGDLGSVALAVRAFPKLERAEKLHLSLAWMLLHDSMSWPKFLENYGALGFNVVPTLSSYDTVIKERTRRKFLSRARDKGFQLLVVDSPYHRMIFNPEARVQSKRGRIEPFVDPAYRGEHYTAELDRIVRDHKEYAPEWSMLDIECFADGAYACLTGTSVRCAERLLEIAGEQGPEPASALTDLGNELISNIRTVIHDAVPKDSRARMGLYATEPGHVYHRLFDFEKLYGNAVDYAQPTFYRDSPERMGTRLRKMRAAMPTGDIIPWMDPGTIDEFPSVWVYDRVLEVFGSGGRGIAWFAYKNFEGSDFYALARALDAVIPVEDVIVGSTPMEKIDVVAGGVAATGISHGVHHLLLLADYETPTRERRVALSLPRGVEGTVWDLARKQEVGRVVKGAVTLDWRPGVERARTALYYVGPSQFEDGRVSIAESPAAHSPH